jgi:hypothetical protein
MTRSLKAAIAAGAALTTMFAGTALAHDPEQLGTPLPSPFGERFSFIANFQTGQNPFNELNKNVTSSDIAFWGDFAYVGDYGGFRIFDISKPRPRLVNDVRCYGAQGDPSVFDTNGDDRADILTLSVDQVLTGPQCGAGPASKPPLDPKNPTADRDYPAGAWEGLRVFDVSNPTGKVEQIAAVYQDCGSHTNTLLPNPKGGSMFVLNSSYPLGEGPTCGPEGTEADNAAAYGIAPRKENHGVVQVIEVPFSNPAGARELTELPVRYPGDADGTYKPRSEQGIAVPLDNFLGCHDLSVFPARGIVGAACGEQAQVWRINKSTGLPDTLNPMWTYDQPNVDFWHSATFSWDGKVTKRGQQMPGNEDNSQPKLFQTGNMFFFETDSGDLLSEYRIERGTNDNASKGEAGTYCSSHLGIPVPAKDRYLLVNAYYRGGSSVIDFTDPTNPSEIAFADMDGTNTWSAYTYPRKNGSQHTIPVYSNDGLSRPYVVTNPDGTTKIEYREAAYGFMRFQADIGKANIRGLDRLNPQLQEELIKTNIKTPKGQRGKRGKFAEGRKSSKRIKGARPADK